MKKTLLSAALSCMIVLGYGQYYYVPNISAGQNPGGLNNDGEYPSGGGQPAGWTHILLGSAATPVWSANQTLPFAFSFNGSAVSQYKVSSSGVLTFDVSTGLGAPSYTRAALPSASIPDKSVCIWGLNAQGSNDYVSWKVFGSAPNRQYWIHFSSYGYGSSISDGSNFAYWSIVLEETSNHIYIVDQRTGGFSAGVKVVSAGVQVDASTAFAVAGSPNLLALATTDASPADNSFYEFIQGAQAANDAALISVSPEAGSIQAYAQTGTGVSIGGTVKNFGSAPISSLAFKYSDGVNTYTDNKVGLNILSGASLNITHNTQFIAAAGDNNLSVWVELTGDANSANDDQATTIVGVSFMPTHNVVFEEATGTWCGWCPRGSVFMDSVSGEHPDAILIAVHNSDPMVVTAYDNGIGSFPGFSGYPSVLADRKEIIDPSEMFTGYDNHRNDFGFADVGISSTYNSSTRDVDATVTANFAVDLSGSYRIALVLTENNVTGTGSTWDQHNYYSFQTNNIPLTGAGHDWQAETDPVPAADMEYDFVARAILGGFTGQTGSLPTSISAGTPYTYNFNYNVDASYDETQMRVIALLVNVSSGEIMNGAQIQGLAGTTGVQEPVQASTMNLELFPNPTSDLVNVAIRSEKSDDVVITLTDVLGKQIGLLYEGSIHGLHNLSTDVSSLDAGMYVISVASKTGLVARPFVKD
jgi:hypothetical protein